MEYQPNLKNITGEGGAVASIVPDSIAAELGLLPGDLILAVDGKMGASPEELLDQLSEHGVGHTILLRTLRGGVARELSVEIGERR